MASAAASIRAPVSSKAHAQAMQYHDDSSEDEIPVPMKLSAYTKALLNDAAVAPAQRPVSPPRTRQRSGLFNASTSSSSAEERRHLRSGSSQAPETRSTRASSPPRSRDVSPVRKRVVRLSNTPQSYGHARQPNKRRSTSITRSATRPRSQLLYERPAESDKPEDNLQPYSGVNTPAQGARVVRIAIGSSGKHSRVGSLGPSTGRSSDRSAVEQSGPDTDSEQYEGPETIARNAPPVNLGSISRYPSTSTRGRQDEMANPQSSMRVKRVGKLPGSFLSGPARRGRRRQSEEDGEGVAEGETLPPTQEQDQAMDDPHAASYYADGIRDFSSGSPVSGTAVARAVHRRHVSNMDIRNTSTRPSPRQPRQRQEPIPNGQPEEHLPAEHIRIKPMVRPDIPSMHDQENGAPASHKRFREPVVPIFEKAVKPASGVDVGLVKAQSPERKPLAAITDNTPHRAAPPPPPKMSVLETATSTAGAATTTQAKQRRNVLKVNGKCYTRLDCIGRGGSAKVYRVTAENGKMLALKRVALENADESTIRGYRGEIDLLGKLSSVDRVINLFDYEMNEEKQVLTLLMEMGELDLHTLIKARQNPEVAKFDPVFVRFYWKEMLECLQSVHEHGVVHSDLKPANFVLVQGRLKLIDFGIANAIQTDQTVNVHRETQVGTPNYMSPESLMDSNNPRGGRLPGWPKLMKVGRPSDVWSLGCILYQMVYGHPPFGHIVNQMARCQAIINWDHAIEFPSRAMGGVPLPPSLLRTMKRCLNRDQHMRPTCEELLYDSDPYLYPAEVDDKAIPVNEELLRRIIQSVVTRCRERMPTEAESVKSWPEAYWGSLRKAMANRP